MITNLNRTSLKRPSLLSLPLFHKYIMFNYCSSRSCLLYSACTYMYASLDLHTQKCVWLMLSFQCCVIFFMTFIKYNLVSINFITLIMKYFSFFPFFKAAHWCHRDVSETLTDGGLSEKLFFGAKWWLANRSNSTEIHVYARTKPVMVGKLDL